MSSSWPAPGASGEPEEKSASATDPNMQPLQQASPPQEPPSGSQATPGQPVYGQPASGQLPYGQPAYGQAPQGHPAQGQPAQSHPSQDHRSHGQGQAPYAPPGVPPGGYPMPPQFGPQPGYPAPGWSPFVPPPQQDGTAIAVMVLGISSLVLLFSCIGFIPAIVALCLAPGSERTIKASGGRISGLGQIRAGRITSWITIGLTILAVAILIAIGVAGGFDESNGVSSPTPASPSGVRG